MTNFKASSIFSLLFIFSALEINAQIPNAKTGVFALTNARVETITNGIIENGTVVLSGGKITAVGSDAAIPVDAVVIDCKGNRIYPGLIDSGTKVGLSEVGSDPRTKDYNELGDVIPQMHVLTAINPHSVLIPVTRVNGVTTVIVSPEGELLPGHAALINLFGYTPDQMYAGFQGVVLTFPNTGRHGLWDQRTEDDIKKSADKALVKLNDVWQKAVDYTRLDSATNAGGLQYYPEMKALVPVIKGELTLMIEVNAAKDIEAALTWIKEKKVKRVILTGVMEGWRVADKIAETGIPVIAGPVLALPSRDYDRYDKAYANPGLLKKAGVKVALRTTQTENVRNLPYHAGFAATYGLGKEEALRAVTIVPAEMFGVDKQLGSIEVGKNATLFIATGDPFETQTKIIQVYIDGWQISMESRQTQLYDEFKQRPKAIEK